MIRYFKYIFPTLITVLLAVSCIEEIAAPEPMQEFESLTLVPRVKSFTNQYVTKAGEDEIAAKERKITSLAVLVFNSEGELVYHNETPITANSPHTLPLNKTMLNSSADETAKLESANIVMFANIPLANIKKTDSNAESGFSSIIDNSSTLTLNDLNENYSYHFDSNQVITSLDENFSGFPMMGRTEEPVDLRASSTNTNIEVSLRILYAKINFEIGVSNDGENYGTGMQFSLSGYSVNNVSKRTTVANPDVTTATSSSDYTTSTISGPENIVDKSASLSGSKAKFSFYMVETRYNHGGINGVYPVGDLPEDVKQQYKPKLATNGTGSPATGLATYVTLNGTYIDYRGTSWTVNYKVYLGKNSYDNFHVDRNSEYTNILTIKGIRNNDSYKEYNKDGILVDQNIWIDHRVNVSTNNPLKHIKVTRETLLDSHIEVRPLRVDLSGSGYAAVQLVLPDVNWIAAERFTGMNCQDGSIYCYNANGESTGKRRYFTTSLISDLKATEGTELILLDNDCAWIYFDENTSADSRPAVINVNFLNDEGKSQKSEEFVISQKGLLTIGDEESGYYNIESYEEYLHTYDSADKYNLTTSPLDYTQEGLIWGLDGKTLSNDFIVSSMQLTSINIPLIGEVPSQNYIEDRYDYFHINDVPSNVDNYYTYTKRDGGWISTSYRTGLEFTNHATLPKASLPNGITINDLGTLPENAYQYCLSKNKFREDKSEYGKHTLDIHWYLPDVHELTAVIDANPDFTDFAKETYYWSSQPSYTNASGLSEYIQGAFGSDLSIKKEDINYARAVSKDGIDNLERDVNARIRCFYSAKGIEDVSMSGDRTPNGIGGNETFYMSAFVKKSKAAAGYFKSLLDNEKKLDLAKEKEQRTVVIEDKDNGTWKYTDDSFAYPKVGNIGEFNKPEYYFETTDNDGRTVKGFKVDITDKQYWTEETKSTAADREAVYYTTLYTYPGLSKYDLEVYKVMGGTVPGYNSYKESGTQKTDTKSDIESTTIKLSKNLQSASLANLSDKLTISFDEGTNSSTYSPIFEYDELEYKAEKKYTRNWEVEYPVSEYTTPTQTYRDVEYSGESDQKEVTARNQDKQTAIDNAKSEAEAAAMSQARTRAEEAANNAHPAATKVKPQEGTESYEQLSYDLDTYRTFGGWRADVTVKYKCTMKFTIEYTGEKKNYYAFPTDSPWHIQKVNGKDYEEIDPIYDKINTDELRMYCGNSFTISLRDQKISADSDLTYKDMYEITNVKVYISGGNYVSEEYSLLEGSRLVTTYARFVDSTLIPEEGNIAEENQGYFDFGTSETITLQGMTYDANSQTNDVLQQWTGAAESVTLVLADHIYDRIAGSNTNAKYYYKTASKDSESHSFVIEKIEVKCTKKAVASN